MNKKIPIKKGIVINKNKKLSLNTHYYDGSLKFDKNQCKSALNFIQIIEEIKKDIINNKKKKEIMRTLQLLVVDRRNNFDTHNKINVEDLLPYIWEIIKKYDQTAKNVFYEQLIDITTKGPCAQGRVTRLMQFL